MSVPVIVDTDMATDCDDAAAVAVLHALASMGEAKILAMVANNKDPASIGAVAAMNAYFGRSEIPLGAYQEDEVGSDAGEFFRKIALDVATYGHTVTSRLQVRSAVEVYRRVLASCDGGVVIVSIGHLNNLAMLLQSQPDRISDLSGAELVQQKTSRLVVMGGDYPRGREHNFFARNSASYAVQAVHNWPVPILFSGFTLGQRVVTGRSLADLPAVNTVRRSYAAHNGGKSLAHGRCSWDQTAVLAAVRGAAPYWDLSSPGRNIVAQDGSNQWHYDPLGTHMYLVEKMPREHVSGEIEQLMRHDPRG